MFKKSETISNTNFSHLELFWTLRFSILKTLPIVKFKNLAILVKNQFQCQINRKLREPRKQGAHFLGARAQIQDSWFFHQFTIDGVPSCLILGI
jgi:hypothetical protein